MKHAFRTPLLYFFAFCSAAITYCHSHKYEEFDFDAFDDVIIVPPPTRQLTPNDVLDILVKIANAPIVLQEDLYKRTHPPLKRPIHDMPSLYSTTNDMPFCSWKLSLQPFYLFTYRADFTKNSNTLDSYINIQNQTILSILQDLDTENRFKGSTILSLFTPLKLQERRLGAMIGGESYHNKWMYWIKTPIVYQERNLFLTNDEKRAIEDAQIFDDNDPRTDLDAQQELFARQHLIADSLGIGDTRIRIGYNAFASNTLNVHIGGEVTIPTAWACIHGLYGSHFPKDAPKGTFNIFDNAQLIFCAHPNLALPLENLLTFATQALDRLSSILLEDKLGNGGHIGLALYTEGSLSLSARTTVNSYAALEYILPAKEQRFYLTQKNMNDFTSRDYMDESMAQENLDFLNQQLINTLFPCMIKTTVTPGAVFKYGSWIAWDFCPLSCSLGYDLWWQQQEHIGSVPRGFKTIGARKDAGLQHKIFGGLVYTHTHEGQELPRWQIGLYGDSTFVQSGIGQDFSVSLRYEINF